MRYQVGITIYNSFEVEADSQEEAENKVRDFSEGEILTDSDFNIQYSTPLSEELRDID